MAKIRLTQYSHGAGCGCKLSPEVLSKILGEGGTADPHPNLLVGNSSRDDAAAVDLEDGRVLLSTTDFFMPIVDDPRTFGRIAATNAISDIYAMGGKPTVAIAILGWPVKLLAPEVAGEVIMGGREACRAAGIPLAGGHSIDSPEPIFGLAVSGLVDRARLKTNSGAKVGDVLLLTKPVGVGILTTAEKKGLLKEGHEELASKAMTTLNIVGSDLSAVAGVNAMTDVTGFGLMGHLLEMCEGSGVGAEIRWDAIPTLTELGPYIEAGCVPGGTGRNYESYGAGCDVLEGAPRAILCDPQTSGGLLVAVSAEEVKAAQGILRAHGLEAFCEPIGHITSYNEGPRVRVL